MISDGIISSLIGLLGGVLAAYISVRVRRKKPKSEYIDTAVAAYEAIMKRQDEELQRKDVVIANQAGEIIKVTTELNRLKRR